MFTEYYITKIKKHRVFIKGIRPSGYPTIFTRRDISHTAPSHAALPMMFDSRSCEKVC